MASAAATAVAVAVSAAATAAAATSHPRRHCRYVVKPRHKCHSHHNHPTWSEESGKGKETRVNSCGGGGAWWGRRGRYSRYGGSENSYKHRYINYEVRI